MTITLDGAAGVATAAPGDVVALNGVTATAALPDWMARYGYNFGLLHAGLERDPRDDLDRGGREQHGRARAGPRGRDRRRDHDRSLRRRIPVGDTVPLRRPAAAHDAMDGARRADRVRPGRARARCRNSRSDPAVGCRSRAAASTSRRRWVRPRSAWTASRGRTSPTGRTRQEQTPEPFATVAVPAFDCIAPVPAASVSVDLVRRRDLPPAVPGVAYGFAPSVGYRLPASYLSSLYTRGAAGRRRQRGDGDRDGRGRRRGRAATAERAGRAGHGAGDRGHRRRATSWASRNSRAGTWMPGTAGLGFAAAAPGAIGTLNVDGMRLRGRTAACTCGSGSGRRRDGSRWTA